VSDVKRPPIVSYAHRYKRPPRKRKTAPLAGPAIVTPKRKQAVPLTVEPMPSRPAIVRKAKPCNDNRPEASSASVDDPPKSAIVTARNPGKRYADVPDMTPEEHQRRPDGADAMMREMKRQIAEKTRT
jgi:hypothetical protein